MIILVREAFVDFGSCLSYLGDGRGDGCGNKPLVFPCVWDANLMLVGIFLPDYNKINFTNQ